MKKIEFKYLSRLVDKITKKSQPNNDNFIYYNHQVTLQSGTVDFVGVTIQDMDFQNEINFSFDYWTKELVFESYNNYEERDAIIKAFKDIYGHVKIVDEPWRNEMDSLEPMLDNDEYDQEEVKQEYDELIKHKA